MCSHRCQDHHSVGLELTGRQAEFSSALCVSFFVCFDHAINPNLPQDLGVNVFCSLPHEGPLSGPFLASPELRPPLWSSPELSAFQPSPGLATPEASL